MPVSFLGTSYFLKSNVLSPYLGGQMQRLRFKAFHSASATLAGIEAAHMIRKGQLGQSKRCIAGP